MAGYSDDDSFGGYSDDQHSTSGYSDDQYSDGGYSDGEEQDFDDDEDEDESGGYYNPVTATKEYEYSGKQTVRYYEPRPREQSSSYQRTAKASYKDKRQHDLFQFGVSEEGISMADKLSTAVFAYMGYAQVRTPTQNYCGKQNDITCYAGSKRKQSSNSNSYQRTAKASCVDKQTGIYARSTTKEVTSMGDTFKERPTGRVGVKNDYTTTKTCRVGDKSGYSEYQVQERYRRVDYDGNNSSKGNSGSKGIKGSSSSKRKNNIKASASAKGSSSRKGNSGNKGIKASSSSKRKNNIKAGASAKGSSSTKGIKATASIKTGYSTKGSKVSSSTKASAIIKTSYSTKGSYH
ncbi:hypothetical protein SLEP1_g28633 [Rubroshorea leprosula]|uniref:Uncharacterized protein n=1 Tax=Rubroshorea leprosula TaxID=152421 RepID=A0AAV5K6G2_9ROSI|nr:hypothetical protein SLEP1_g28633 [Rubroshorea leprosula]